MKPIPKNFRRLKTNEVIKPGDWYIERKHGDNRGLVTNAMYFVTKVRNHPVYTFWRKRIKITVKLMSHPVVVKTSTTKPAAKIPIVQFQYPHAGTGLLKRIVHVISYDSEYLTGLERIRGWNGVGDHVIKYQFKKFKTSCILANNDGVTLLSFKPKQ